LLRFVLWLTVEGVDVLPFPFRDLLAGSLFGAFLEVLAQLVPRLLDNGLGVAGSQVRSGKRVVCLKPVQLT